MNVHLTLMLSDVRLMMYKMHMEEINKISKALGLHISQYPSQ